DESTGAYEKVVDQLLANPQHGVRYAQRGLLDSWWKKATARSQRSCDCAVWGRIVNLRRIANPPGRGARQSSGRRIANPPQVGNLPHKVTLKNR
ncbi:MAG TPA: hypothetical protein VKJ01_02050, partial [Candidatus Solibacter sp.]|nr:hypothetical protein [Candidatus Solibacter sp.]